MVFCKAALKQCVLWPVLFKWNWFNLFVFVYRVNMNSTDLSGIKLYPVEMVTVDESLK